MTTLEWMPFSVLVPLIGAPVCALLPGRRLPWLMALACALASLCIAAATLSLAIEAPLSYAFGNWAPPIGIEYRVDAVNAYIALLVTGIAVPILLWGRASVDSEVAERQGVFYALFLLCFAGLLGMTLTGDAFNVFVFLEISSLATYALVAHGKERRALLASFRYLVMGTVGATFFLIGIGFLYMMTGTLNMEDLAQRMPEIAQTNTARAALAFIIVGMGLKLAMFPLHLWLPNAYAYAPSFVTAFLAATATKVALYVLLRFVLTVFTPAYSFAAIPQGTVLTVLAVAGMFAGSWAAMFEPNLKRMLAYSSVAQIGYMLLGMSLASSLGLTATLLHMFNHALIKAALFMALGTVVYRIGAAGLDDIRGLGRAMPWTFTAFVLAGLSLIGVPLTVGFVSKWYLIQAALVGGAWWLVILIVVTSLMAVIYVWRVVEAAWFGERPADAPPVAGAPLGMLLPVWALVAANFYFGVDTRLTVGVASRAADVLLGGGG
jgi:multicomponent Na+:H+ antiporter subunit D